MWDQWTYFSVLYSIILGDFARLFNERRGSSGDSQVISAVETAAEVYLT
jgi:hypothetical protein